MKEAMKASIFQSQPGHIVDAILEENHAEPRHIPIKSPAPCNNLYFNMKPSLYM